MGVKQQGSSCKTNAHGILKTPLNRVSPLKEFNPLNARVSLNKKTMKVYKVTAKRFETVIQAESIEDAVKTFRDLTHSRRYDDIMDIEEITAQPVAE